MNLVNFFNTIKMRLKYILLLVIVSVLKCHAFSQEITKKPIVIQVMTYNIHHANPPAKEHVIDIDAIARTITDTGADIVALQEVDVRTKRSGYINEAEILAKKLNMHVFFSKAIDFDEGEYGLAILSKFKIENPRSIRLSSVADTSAEPRILQLVTLKIAKTTSFLFANTHLDVLETGNRLLQAKQITELVRSQNLPMIIAGDWNDTITSKTLDIMDGEFTRSCEICPVTCQEDEKAIDFIAYSKSSLFKIKKHTVFNENNSSDHYPVLAEIAIY